MFSSKDYHVWHASDVTRMRILMEYGGIFLDNDVYVVQNLNKFRNFEMAVSMKEDKSFMTQVLTENNNSRFYCRY
jgi:mannosyltransferase OCH1-like enzyme